MNNELETGDFVRFETSKGILTGTVSGTVPNEYCELEFDEENSMLLNQLYRHCGASVRDGWVKVDLEDGHYGTPEYKVIDEDPEVDLKDPQV